MTDNRTPAAWLAVAADGSESSAVYLLQEHAEAAAREWGWFVAPLYALPVLRAEDEIARLKDAIRRLADQDATLSVCDGNVTVTIDATLAAKERKAIGVAIQCVVAARAQRHPEEEKSRELLHKSAATLRSLLERLA